MRSKGLNAKINLLVIVIMLVVFTVILCFLSFNEYVASVKNERESIIGRSQAITQTIHQLHVKNLQSAKDLEMRINTLISGSNPRNREDLMVMLEEAMKANDKIFAIALCFEPNAFDGKDMAYVNKPYHDGTGRVIPYMMRGDAGFETIASFDYEKESSYWYSVPKNTKKLFVTEPYPVKLSDEKTLLLSTIALPLIDPSGKFIGVINIDTEISELQKLIEDMTNTGRYSCLITENGTVVAHGGKVDFVMKNAMEIKEEDAQSVSKIKSGNLFESNNKSQIIDGKVLNLYMPINFEGTEINWVLKSTVSYNQILASFYDNLKVLVPLALVALVITILIISIVLKKTVIQPIATLTDSILKQSELDFSIEVNSRLAQYENHEDEIGVICRALRTMEDNVRLFVVKTSETVQHIAESSRELTSTSELVSSSAGEVAKTIEEIANGASEQAKDTETTALNIEEMGRLLEEDGKLIAALNQSTMVINTQKEDGNVILRELILKTDQSSDSANMVYEIIVSNNESAEKIESASSMIRNIADQTNLLALNAAIEAARAGEAGKGFAVVADEIRKLAIQSNKFTSDIKLVIDELKMKSQSAVQTMENVKMNVDSQTECVKATEGKFILISQAIDAINDVISELNNSAEAMKNNKNKVVELTQNLSAISEENAASTEEATASVEEQVAMIAEIAGLGKNLASVADELNGLIHRFRV